MNYLRLWTENVVSRSSISLKAPIEIEGACNCNLGPRWEYAEIRLLAEPSNHFDVQLALGSRQVKFEQEGYIQSAIFGILDALLISNQVPLTNVRLKLIEFKDHDVDSSANAFRMAGRDAGKKLLNAAISQMLRS